MKIMTTTIKTNRWFSFCLLFTLFVIVFVSCKQADESSIIPLSKETTISSITMTVNAIEYTAAFEASKDSILLVIPAGTKLPASIKVKFKKIASGAIGVFEGQTVPLTASIPSLPTVLDQARFTVTAEDGVTTKIYKVNFTVAPVSLAAINSLKFTVNGVVYTADYLKNKVSAVTINLPSGVAMPTSIKIDDVVMAAGSTGVAVNQEFSLKYGKAVFTASYVDALGVVSKNDFSVTLVETFTIDGFLYHAVYVGNQIWTLENLRTTKYNDGTTIPGVINVIQPGTVLAPGYVKPAGTIFAAEWSKMDTAAYCVYNNSAGNKSTYGLIYNWHDVNKGKLAPPGWHISTDADWVTMQNWLIANGYNYDKSDLTSNNFVKSIAATSTWASSATTGCAGNSTVSPNNQTGFAAVAGGCITDLGVFTNATYGSYWWTSNEANATNATYRYIYFNDPKFGKLEGSKRCGFYVRLVKD
jgi:uncharacterized protein (TIGR02145 family)